MGEKGDAKVKLRFVSADQKEQVEKYLDNMGTDTNQDEV